MKSAVTRKLFQPLCNYAVVTASLGVRPNVYQKKIQKKKIYAWSLSYVRTLILK